MAKRKSSRRVADSPDRTEKALLAAIKRHRGESLTQAESRDLAWYDKAQADAVLSAALTAIPKGLYCQMAGRQQKVVDGMGERYRLPTSGPTVDLFDAIETLYTLVADNSRQIMPANLVAAEDDDEEVTGAAKVHLLKLKELEEKVRKLKHGNDRLQIALAHDRGDTIDRQELRGMLSWLSTRLSGFGQQLRRSNSGEEAQKACNEFLEHLASEVEHGVLKV